MWRQSFPSGDIFEVMLIPLPTTPLEGILSMTTVVTLSSCTATSSSGQAIISLFMGMQMCSSCVTKNKTGDSSTTTIPVDKMTVWDHLEDCTRVVLSYGRWEAGWPESSVTTPKKYAALTARPIGQLQQHTREEQPRQPQDNNNQASPSPVPIHFLTLNQTPLGDRALACSGKGSEELPSDGCLQCRAVTPIPSIQQQYNKSSAPMRFVDNRDLNDPLWDSADG